jgi:hypothetical protein
MSLTLACKDEPTTVMLQGIRSSSWPATFGSCTAPLVLTYSTPAAMNVGQAGVAALPAQETKKWEQLEAAK